MRSYLELLEQANSNKSKISEIVILREMEATGLDREQLLAKMKLNYSVMQQSVEQGLTSEWRSFSGMVGGDAARLIEYGKSERTLLGHTMNKVAARAIAAAEINAGMGRIVAAPTGGACGVLPAVMITVQEIIGSSEEEIIMAFFTAAGIGMVIAERASVSGAEGGCQAEIGTASAMAAGAAVELAGGTPEQTAHAGAIALKNFLGMVCDPVGGLVEVPCIKRNAMGAIKAMTAAEMALAGIKSAIPLDEVIDTMASIGRQMPCSLRETAQGGLAVTPTGKRIEENIFRG
ncbi:MAG: serine dehydratase [Gracilibacter sp. BRH_c7a]|nr:MAG: serine dehydratase [Gracilibacter sp. BRH_c7a]